MTETPRVHNPGWLTYAAHLLIAGAVALAWAPLVALRWVFVPVAEGLIRATDWLFDELLDRLSR